MFLVLEKLYAYIGHNSWQTRIAAVQVAIGFPPVLKFLVFFHAILTFSPHF